MEAKELMIGDWVYYDPNVFIEDEYEPYKEIYPTKIENGEEIDLAIEHCYSPIPLTPEILEKNGFIRSNQVSDEPPYYIDEEGNMHYSLNNNGKETFWGWWQQDSTFLIPANGMGWITFKYVHELQHALRLIGINKEIEL